MCLPSDWFSDRQQAGGSQSRSAITPHSRRPSAAGLYKRLQIHALLSPGQAASAPTPAKRKKAAEIPLIVIAELAYVSRYTKHYGTRARRLINLSLALIPTSNGGSNKSISYKKFHLDVPK